VISQSPSDLNKYIKSGILFNISTGISFSLVNIKLSCANVISSLPIIFSTIQIRYHAFSN